jgi:Peptidase dimerisation domain
MVRTSIAPTIVNGGFRSNVIPSEAKATLDVRFLPEQDADALLEQVKKVIDDPEVDVRFSGQFGRPRQPNRFRGLPCNRGIDGTRLSGGDAAGAEPGRHRHVVSTRQGIKCCGIGPALDVEEVPKGFGPHSDQERLLESELHRFVRVQWEIITALASRQ